MGIITLRKEMPPALMAMSSYFSPKLPIVMMEAKRTAMGNAIGTNVAEAYKSSWAMTLNSNPLPTKSSIYFQTNCISSTNTAMANVSRSGPKKDFNISLSSFFIYYLLNQPVKSLNKSLPLATINRRSRMAIPIF